MVIGIAPPGFFGETLRSDPPDIWIPVQQEPLIARDAALLHQSVGAWLRVIGRLHPGASTAGMAPRLAARSDAGNRERTHRVGSGCRTRSPAGSRARTGGC